MGTYIRTCAEKRTSNGWQPISYGAFPPVLWHDLEGYEIPPYSEPFRDQNYGMFGLFAGETNYSQCHVLSAPRGFPEDISEAALLFLIPAIAQADTFCGYGQFELTQPRNVADLIDFYEPDAYGYSWLSAAELLSFDYDQTFTDQRTTPPQETTYREFLGQRYFLHLEALRAVSAHDEVRVLFCFN